MMTIRRVALRQISLISEFCPSLSLQDHGGKTIYLYSIMIVESLSLKPNAVNAEKYCKVSITKLEIHFHGRISCGCVVHWRKKMEGSEINWKVEYF